MVVFAVNVRADRAADGDLAGAGQYRNPQPVGQCGLHQLVEGDAAVNVHDGGFGVDGVDDVQRLHVDYDAAGILCGVTVGAAHATGDDAALEVVWLFRVLVRYQLDGFDDFLDVGGGKYLGGGRGGAAPACELASFCVQAAVGTVRSFLSDGAGRACVASHCFPGYPLFCCRLVAIA